MTPIRRLSARAYASLVGKSEDTIQRQCRAGILIARRSGEKHSRWEIDVEKSERALSLRYGNAAEKELTRKSLR